MEILSSSTSSWEGFFCSKYFKYVKIVDMLFLECIVNYTEKVYKRWYKGVISLSLFYFVDFFKNFYFFQSGFV